MRALPLAPLETLSDVLVALLKTRAPKSRPARLEGAMGQQSPSDPAASPHPPMASMVNFLLKMNFIIKFNAM
jgi:hypothetical protein